jgi:phosphate transport system substrate-binding protein
VLVQGVSRDVNALGFFGYAYYAENKDKLKALPIAGRAARPVEPSRGNVLNGTYQPLSRPIFIYVNAKSRPSARSEEVRRVLHEGMRPKLMSRK